MPSFKIRGLPVKGVLLKRETWQVTVRGEETKSIFSIERTQVSGVQGGDIWRLRNDFFAIETAQDALNFCGIYGSYRIPATSLANVLTDQIAFESPLEDRAWFKQLIGEPTPD